MWALKRITDCVCVFPGRGSDRKREQPGNPRCLRCRDSLGHHVHGGLGRGERSDVLGRQEARCSEQHLGRRPEEKGVREKRGWKLAKIRG